MDRRLGRRCAALWLLIFMLATSCNIAYATKYSYGLTQTTATVRTPTVQLQPGTAGSSTISNGVYATVVPLYYVPITLTNNQGSSTPNPFQVLIQPNPSSYSTYEASDLGNIRFCANTLCTTKLYSWLEGCGASSPYGSCSTSSTSAAFWVKLTSAISPGGGTLTIYMAFLQTSTDFDGIVAGESPTLSSTYGGFDNGANVFNFYDNFVGTSGPSTSSWTTSTSSGDGSFATNNMLIITCAAHTAHSDAVVEKTALTAPQVAEADVVSQTGSQWTGLGVGSGWDISIPSGSSYPNDVANNGYTISWNGQTGTQFDRFWVDSSGAKTMVDSTAVGSITSLPAGVWRVSWNATGHESANDGVGSPGSFTETNSGVSLPSSYVMVIGEASSSGASGTVDIQWARMRATPPSNRMPSASFGGVTLAANGVILTFTNSGSSSWLANLALVSSATSGTSRLYNLTISFQNPSSKQVILGTGVTNQNSGPQVTLAASATISITMGVTVSSSGTSTITLALMIQVPPATGATSAYCYDVIVLTVD